MSVGLSESFPLERQEAPTAGASLRDAEDPYRTFVRLSREGIFRFDLDPSVDVAAPAAEQIDAFLHHSVCADANDALARMYGLPSASALLGAPLSSLLSPEDPETRAYLQAFIEGGHRLSEVDSHERDTMGRPRVFSNTVLGVVREGRLVRVWGTQRDVTAQREAERALRESEARSRAILNASFDAIILADCEGRILEFNPSAEFLFDIERDRMLGRNLDDVLSLAPHEEPALPILSTLLQAGRRVEAVGTRGGRAFPAEVSAHRLVLPEGGDALAVFVRDLSPWKEYEAELVLARDRAEEAARLKASMLANMSHEIRTPLTAILGYSDLIGEAGGEVGEYAELIQKGGRRLLHTLNSVLDLARLESGTESLETSPLDVSELAREAVAFYALDATDKGLRLEAEIEPGVLVRGDTGALSRVIDNLVSNAIKFTQDGSVTLAVDRTPHHARVRVTDTGVGIAPDLQAHIFEAFRQASTGFARTHEGTGLGLTLAHRLVTLMEGTLSVSSELGRGSTFTILLPLGEAGALRPS